MKETCLTSGSGLDVFSTEKYPQFESSHTSEWPFVQKLCWFPNINFFLGHPVPGSCIQAHWSDWYFLPLWILLICIVNPSFCVNCLSQSWHSNFIFLCIVSSWVFKYLFFGEDYMTYQTLDFVFLIHVRHANFWQ